MLTQVDKALYNCLFYLKNDKILFLKELHNQCPVQFKSLVKNERGDGSVLIRFFKCLVNELREHKTRTHTNTLSNIMAIFQLLPDLKNEVFFNKKNADGLSILSLCARIDELPTQLSELEIIGSDQNTKTLFDLVDENNNTFLHLVVKAGNEPLLRSVSASGKMTKEVITKQNVFGHNVISLAYEDRKQGCFNILRDSFELSENETLKNFKCAVSQEIYYEPYSVITTGSSAVLTVDLEYLRNFQVSGQMNCPRTGIPIKEIRLNHDLKASIISLLKDITL